MAWTWGSAETAAITLKKATENKTMTLKNINPSGVGSTYMYPDNITTTCNALAAIAGISFVMDGNAQYTLMNKPTET